MMEICTGREVPEGRVAARVAFTVSPPLVAVVGVLALMASGELAAPGVSVMV